MPDFNPKDSREGFIYRYRKGTTYTIYPPYTSTDPMEVRASNSSALGYGLWARTYFGFDTSSLAGQAIDSARLLVSIFHDSSTATTNLGFHVGSDLLHDPLQKADYWAENGMVEFYSLPTSSISTSSSNPTRVSADVPADKVNVSGWTDFGIINPRTSTVDTYAYRDRVYSTNNSDSSLWPVLEVTLASGARRIFHAVHQ